MLYCVTQPQPKLIDPERWIYLDLRLAPIMQLVNWVDSFFLELEHRNAKKISQ
jgi:hypothetical protein